MLAANFNAELAHHAERHGFVSFVNEIERFLAARIVADDALEDDERAVRGRFELLHKLGSANRGADDFTDVAWGGNFGAGSLPSTDGREKGDFIAGRDGRVPFRVLLIYCGGDRWAKAFEFREAAAVTRENVSDARTRREFGAVFAKADDFFQAAEEENSNEHEAILAVSADNANWRVRDAARIPTNSFILK